MRQAPSPPDAPGATDETPPAPPADGVITLTANQQKEIRETVDQLFESFEKATERAGEAETLAIHVQEALNTKQQQAIWWWFQYLGLFFVPNTKWVLHWFATRTTQATREWFHEEWKARIPSAKEREIILSVLLHHELLVENGSLLAVSEAGHAFLEFLRQQGFWFPAL